MCVEWGSACQRAGVTGGSSLTAQDLGSWPLAGQVTDSYHGRHRCENAILYSDFLLLNVVSCAFSCCFIIFVFKCMDDTL